MLVTGNLEHAFSVELKNKQHLRRISISDQAHERVLLEGNLGKLVQMTLVEGDILELIGANGVLRISLTREHLEDAIKAAESSLSAEEGRSKDTQAAEAVTREEETR